MQLPQTDAQWELILQLAWAHVTPFALVLAAVVLGIRLFGGKRWKSRMARASFFLIASYAVLMVRVILGYYVPESRGGGGYPLPEFAALYLVAALYFLYALIIEWVLPFLYRAFTWLTRPPWAPRPDRETHEPLTTGEDIV